MPQQDDALIEIVGFDWVPPFARGHVRDLRARWALEEIGLPYRTRLISVRDRPPEYFAEQPFGQVPAYHEGGFHLFESGAIALHIAHKDARLLPDEPIERARAVSWLICALSSVEPYIMNMITIDIFARDEEWAKLRAPAQARMVDNRLRQLADALGDKPWLEDRFTIADLMMVSVLRELPGLSAKLPPSLAAYVARGEARPAFQAALAAQMADFTPDEEGVSA